MHLCTRSSHLSPKTACAISGWIWHLVLEKLRGESWKIPPPCYSSGCRGVTGPVPQPLSIRGRQFKRPPPPRQLIIARANSLPPIISEFLQPGGRRLNEARSPENEARSPETEPHSCPSELRWCPSELRWCPNELRSVNSEPRWRKNALRAPTNALRACTPEVRWDPNEVRSWASEVRCLAPEIRPFWNGVPQGRARLKPSLPCMVGRTGSAGASPSPLIPPYREVPGKRPLLLTNLRSFPFPHLTPMRSRYKV